MSNPTPDYSARLAWARQHDPALADNIESFGRSVLACFDRERHAQFMHQRDALLSTLDQRYREAHAGPPDRWGHAELVAEVGRLREALSGAPSGAWSFADVLNMNTKITETSGVHLSGVDWRKAFVEVLVIAERHTGHGCNHDEIEDVARLTELRAIAEGRR